MNIKKLFELVSAAASLQHHLDTNKPEKPFKVTYMSSSHKRQRWFVGFKTTTLPTEAGHLVLWSYDAEDAAVTDYAAAQGIVQLATEFGYKDLKIIGPDDKPAEEDEDDLVISPEVQNMLKEIQDKALESLKEGEANEYV